MRLHDYWRSSAAFRCRIAFALKGIALESVVVDLASGTAQRSPGYLAVNPQGLVPALEVDGAVLTQSLAIIEWLDETHPQPSLLPGSAVQRAQIRGFALSIACEVSPLQNLRVQQFLRNDTGADKAAVQRWLDQWIGDGLAACEALLAGQPEGERFAFADAPTLADVVLAPQLYAAARFGVATDHLPRIAAMGKAYASHPAFMAAHPANQPGALA